MAVEIRIDPDLRCVFALFVGAVDLDSLMALERGQLEDPRFDPGMHQMVMLPGDCRVTVGSAEFRVFADRPPIFEPEARRAIVAESGVGFGVARMFELIKADSAGHILVTGALDEGCRHVGVPRESVEAALRGFDRGPWQDAV
jgi:hypothetical protein